MFLNSSKAKFVIEAGVVSDLASIRIFTNDMNFTIQNNSRSDGSSALEIYEIERDEDISEVYKDIPESWKEKGHFEVFKKAYISNYDCECIKAIGLGPGFYRVFSFGRNYLLIKQPLLTLKIYNDPEDYYK